MRVLATGKSTDRAGDSSICPTCGADLRTTCPIYSRELDGKGQPALPPADRSLSSSFHIRSWVLWSTSLGVWIFVGLAATLTFYQMYRMTGSSDRLAAVAAMQFSQMLAFVPLTPFAFRLAMRYPIQRGNWIKPVCILFVGGQIFALGHILLRGFTPYGYWSSAARHWTYTFWDVQAHSLRFPWQTVKSVYMANVVDDVLSTYVAIVLIAHALVYSHHSQQKDLRATHLSEQLAKARLQVLKNQIQPHFLFNTLHSISALMLTNVVAADRMMTSLSDLLRMSLEDKGSQLTTLNRDLEFLGVYVEIEKARFEDRLRVAFDIDPECLDTQVPHLFLQPLVENAVRHGTSKRSQPGEIRVTAKRHDGNLEFWIRDNGPGFTGPAEDLFRRGLGLSVTRERLEALYGSEQQCKVRNLETGGAEVYVCVPFRLAPNPSQTDAVEYG